MKASSKIPFQNRNHTGWWIFREVEQWVSNRQKKLLPGSRCPVWENTRLLRADSREEAYEKALALGMEGHPSKTHDGEWQFAGISMLLPVYEAIEDGAEILWTERGRMTVAAIRRLAKSKDRLAVFGDKDATNDTNQRKSLRRKG